MSADAASDLTKAGAVEPTPRRRALIDLLLESCSKREVEYARHRISLTLPRLLRLHCMDGSSVEVECQPEWSVSDCKSQLRSQGIPQPHIYVQDADEALADEVLVCSIPADSKLFLVMEAESVIVADMDWGPLGRAKVCCFRHSEPKVFDLEKLEAWAAPQGLVLPSPLDRDQNQHHSMSCGIGCIFSQAYKDHGTHVAARRFMVEHVQARWDECTFDSVLVVQHSSMGHIAHSSEKGSMHAWGDPDTSRGFAFSRGGEKEAKAFHVVVLVSKDNQKS
jgi:hypothetical protein